MNGTARQNDETAQNRELRNRRSMPVSLERVRIAHISLSKLCCAFSVDVLRTFHTISQGVLPLILCSYRLSVGVLSVDVRES